jgi:hypothetical protein
VASAACIRALEDAHNLAQVAGTAFGHAGEYPPLIARAAQAAASGDVAAAERVASDEGHITSRIGHDTGTVSQEVDAFKRDAAGCEATAP